MRARGYRYRGREPGSRSRWPFAVVAALLVGGSSAPAVAQSDLPQGRFAVVVAGRENVGALGGAFGRGWLAGVEAGWQPGRLGIAWSMMWGRFTSTDQTRVDSVLDITEMQLGLRVHWPIGKVVPRFLIASAGAGITRSGIPIPPDEARSYVGPYLGIGMAQLLSARYMFGLEARYGMFVGGPQGLTVNLSFAFGSE